MKYISVDFELDGPSIPHYSVVCFGAVVIDNKLNKTFYGKMAPISDRWIPEALAISGFTREQHLTFKKPQVIMPEFLNWVKEYGGDKVSFVSDCLTGDWLAANYYFHEFTGENPFGYSGRRLSDIICGMNHNLKTKWKDRKSKERIHDPVFDAIENAKVFMDLEKEGLKV